MEYDKRIETLLQALEESGIRQLAHVMNDRKRLLFRSFLSGIFRGLGAANRVQRARRVCAPHHQVGLWHRLFLTKRRMRGRCMPVTRAFAGASIPALRGGVVKVW